MEPAYLSPETKFSLKDGRIFKFKIYQSENETYPSPKFCKGTLKCVSLSYGYSPKQNYDLTVLKKYFCGIKHSTKITQIPAKLRVIKNDFAKAILFGKNVQLNQQIIDLTRKVPFVSYWDDSNILLCASSQYSSIIDSIEELLKSNNAYFDFNKGLFGYDLLINSL